MRKVLVVGIGSGDPDHLTVQAVRALNRVDVFFVIDKGGAKADLVALRTEILARHVRPGRYRIVEAPDPERDRTADAYREAVVDWQDRRARIYERMITEELGEDGCGAFLVWGDPSLYDGTLRLLDHIAGRAAVAFDVEAIPGISSVAALAAAHRLVLNRIGSPVLITTGRRLAAGLPPDVDDVVVMLDGGGAFADLTEPDIEIYWGAYVGSPDEVLVSGRLQEVKGEIQRLRATCRERKGWIMDTYLLRRRPTER